MTLRELLAPLLDLDFKLVPLRLPIAGRSTREETDAPNALMPTTTKVREYIVWRVGPLEMSRFNAHIRLREDGTRSRCTVADTKAAMAALMAARLKVTVVGPPN